MCFQNILISDTILTGLSAGIMVLWMNSLAPKFRSSRPRLYHRLTLQIRRLLTNSDGLGDYWINQIRP